MTWKGRLAVVVPLAIYTLLVADPTMAAKAKSRHSSITTCYNGHCATQNLPRGKGKASTQHNYHCVADLLSKKPRRCS